MTDNQMENPFSKKRIKDTSNDELEKLLEGQWQTFNRKQDIPMLGMLTISELSGRKSIDVANSSLAVAKSSERLAKIGIWIAAISVFSSFIQLVISVVCK